MKLPKIARAILHLINVRLITAHERNRLQALDEGLLKMKEFHMDADAGGTNIKAMFQEDPAASLYVAAAFCHMILGAENYREIAFTPNMAAQAKLGCHFVTVTIQKHGKRTPHQLRGDAEQSLARLQFAVQQAAQPFVGPLEWLGPENLENNVRDSDVIMAGAGGRITLGDLRKVVALLKEPDASAKVRVLDKTAEKLVTDMATDAANLLHKLQKEAGKRGAYSQRGYLRDMISLVGAHLNTITRHVIGENAPVYDPLK